MIDEPLTNTSSTGASLNAILDLFQSAGASAKTAKQDHLPGGVASSETMAKTDRNRVMASKEKFKVAALAHALPPALLAAIALMAMVALPPTARAHDESKFPDWSGQWRRPEKPMASQPGCARRRSHRTRKVPGCRRIRHYDTHALNRTIFLVIACDKREAFAQGSVRDEAI